MEATALSRDRASPGLPSITDLPALSLCTPSLLGGGSSSPQALLPAWELPLPAWEQGSCSSLQQTGWKKQIRMLGRIGHCARRWAQGASRVCSVVQLNAALQLVFVTPHHRQSRWKEHSKHSPSQITEPVNHYFMSWKAGVVVLVLRGFLCLFWDFSPQIRHSMLLPGLTTQPMTHGSAAEFISWFH